MEVKYQNTFGTFFLDAARDVKMLKSFESEGFHQKIDIEMLSSLVAPTDAVVDIGAHIGTFTIPFARKARKVYSFEPMSASFAFLQKNIKENGLDNISVYNCAASDAEGALAIEATPNLAGTVLFKDNKGILPAKRVDDVVPLGERVSLIKVDVEGMELLALKGSERIIKKHRPAVFFEVNRDALNAHGFSQGSLERFFRSHNYVFYRIEKIKNNPRFARLFTLYQGTFFDCLALPREHLIENYFSAISFFLFQLRRKFVRFFA
jgi:FkbM family methyltransferase